MTDADRFAAETRELRHCIHDLVALSTLPAAWLEVHSTTDTGGHRGDDALDARFRSLSTSPSRRDSRSRPSKLCAPVASSMEI